MDDARLVGLAVAGDRAAFGAIYDRYADRIHDFAWGVLRNREDAADVTQDTFLLAGMRLAQLSDPSKLRPWLYAIARNECTRRGRARSRAAPSEEMAEVAATGRGPDDLAASTELGRLLWEAAAGLSERDRTILELHLRHGLEGEELGRALGVTTQHGYVLAARLREQIGKSLGALLIARAGRRDCPELAEILRGWDGGMSPLLRKRVARHVDRCEMCGRRQATLLQPATLLGALPLVPAPAHVREHVLDHVDLVAHRRGLDGARWGADGFPPGIDDRTGRRRTGLRSLGAAAVVAGLLGLGAVAVSNRAEPLGETTIEAGSATSTAASSTTAAGPAASTVLPSTAAPSVPASSVPGGTPTTLPPPPPGSPPTLVLGTGRVDFGSSSTSLAVNLENRGGQPTDWSATGTTPWLTVAPGSGRLGPGEVAVVTVALDRRAAPEGDISVPVRFGWPGGSTALTVSGRVERVPIVSDVRAPDQAILASGCKPDRTTVSALVTDETSLKAVDLSWTVAGGAQGSIAMSRNLEGRWEATLGPFAAEAKVTYVVSAIDARGNAASSAPVSLLVTPCGPP